MGHWRLPWGLLAPALAALSYEHLREDPAAWGADAPVGLLALPCRKQRSTWNFERCCASRHRGLSDEDIEEQFQQCFQKGSAAEIRYAMEVCCDDRAAVLMSNQIFQSYFDFAVCLSNCTPSEDLLAPDCSCEKSFIHQVLRQLKELPQKKKKRMAKWTVRMAPHWKRLRRGEFFRKPTDFMEENLRYALRMLEHLFLSPQLYPVPEAGQPAQDRPLRFPGAHDLHASLTSQLLALRRERLSTLPRRAVPSDAAPAVHVAMIASVGAPPYGRQALATLRSALYHAERRKLHFHLFADKAGRADVEAAMEEHLEPWLKLRLAKVDFYGSQNMKEVWPVLSRYVPQSCMAKTRTYGFPGWMRLFPDQLKWKSDVEELIWVDAGDFLFLADPAALLEEHREMMRKEKRLVATASEKLLYPLQVFDLPKMRAAKWTAMVGRLIGSEWRTNRTGDHNAVCYMGEGMFMQVIGHHYPHIFGTVSGEWAHEPRIPFYNGVVQKPESWGGYRDAPEIFINREHPGLIDATRAYVFCPTFADWWAHCMATVTNNYPFFVVEVAQVFERIQVESMLMLDSVSYLEAPAYGLQEMRCGRRILGLHLVRQFHLYMPWSLRVLDFWSNITGLWGKSLVFLEKDRQLPGNVNEVD